MEDIVNRQIEMISVCAADGALTPIRFRMVEAIQYLCKTQLGQQEALLELRYTVRTHRWTLFRVVYGCPG